MKNYILLLLVVASSLSWGVVTNTGRATSPKPVLTSRAPCTVTLTSATNHTIVGTMCWRTHDMLHLEGVITFAGAGGAAVAAVLVLPSGYVIDTAKLGGGSVTTTNGSSILGVGEFWDQGVGPKPAYVQFVTTTSVGFHNSTGILQLADFGASDGLKFKVEVPIVGWN